MTVQFYVAGPISYIEDGNRAPFELMRQTLSKLGIKPIIPHDLFTPEEVAKFTDDQFLVRCIPKMCECAAVITLQGWENSRGAWREKKIADILNIDVVHFTNLHGYLKKRSYNFMPVTEAEEVVK